MYTIIKTGDKSNFKVRIDCGICGLSFEQKRIPRKYPCPKCDHVHKVDMIKKSSKLNMIGKNRLKIIRLAKHIQTNTPTEYTNLKNMIHRYHEIKTSRGRDRLILMIEKELFRIIFSICMKNDTIIPDFQAELIKVMHK